MDKNQMLSFSHKSTVTIGDKKLVSFRFVRGTPYVNVRSYKQDEHGRMFATKRGIMLGLAEWRKLKEDTDIIDAQVHEFLERAEKEQKPPYTIICAPSRTGISKEKDAAAAAALSQEQVHKIVEKTSKPDLKMKKRKKMKMDGPGSGVEKKKKVLTKN